MLLLLGLFQPFIYGYLLFYRFAFTNVGFWRMFSRFPDRSRTLKMTCAFLKGQAESRREELSTVASFFCRLSGCRLKLCAPVSFVSGVVRWSALVGGPLLLTACSVSLCPLRVQLSVPGTPSQKKSLLNWAGNLYISRSTLLL